MHHARIFIASSEELKDERQTIGGLVCRLEKVFADEGFSLELLMWEDFDSAYNGRRKQDEYNDKIRTSDLLIGLFWTKAGGFTVEEYEVAKKYFSDSYETKIDILIKDTRECGEKNDSLTHFVENTLTSDKIKPIFFKNLDELKLAFVNCILRRFPLKNVQLSECDGVIRLGRVKVANLN